MDMSNLAKMMLDWETLQTRADELKAAIEDTVMQIGTTQTVGNVRATYSAGRKSYDYETAWRAGGYGTGVDIEQYARISYDYRGACKEAGIDDVPFTQSAPAVSVKLLA